MRRKVKGVCTRSSCAQKRQQNSGTTGPTFTKFLSDTEGHRWC